MKARLPAFIAAALSACLSGCLEEKVAGGSSEVDNPILVAFVDSAGSDVTTSGTVSIYLAGQNPALDPYPLLTKQLTKVSSIKLTARDFTGGSDGDSAISYNILFIGDDSAGALLQNITYDPSTGRYTFDSVTAVKIKASVTPLVRYEALLDLPNDNGLVRVFIPGSPFQSVVVDSSFVLEDVPRGTFSLRVLGGDGSERPLKPAHDHQGRKHHKIDSAAPPIQRPPPPPILRNLKVFAGDDVSLSASTGGGGTPIYSLFGSVQGADPNDPRLAVKWRQIHQGSQSPKAAFEDPTSLSTRVAFPRPAAYQFILSAVLGTGQEAQRVEDTVLIVIEAPPEQPVFNAPAAGSTVYIWNENSPTPPETIAWEGNRTDTLLIDLSYDGGNAWTPVSPALVSRPALNTYDWYHKGDSTSTARLRLKNAQGETVAISPLFAIRHRPLPALKTRVKEESEPQASPASASPKNSPEAEAPEDKDRNPEKGPRKAPGTRPAR